MCKLWAKGSAHEITERLDIKNFREIDPDLSQCAYAFRKSGFTCVVMVFVDFERFELSK